LAVFIWWVGRILDLLICCAWGFCCSFVVAKPMLKQHIQSLRPLSFLMILLVLGLSSCINYKNQIFFQGLKDTAYTASMQQADLQIQRGDQLSIFVYAADAVSTAAFNAPMFGGGANGAQVLSQQQGGSQGGGYFGYLVDEYGNIEYPKLGVIPVLGMTQPQLRDTLQSRLKVYLKDAVVSVRLMNFRVTFINADRAMTTMVTNNKTNLLQFLGMVGGVQWMDQRNNIRVIRQVNDQRQVYTVNLTDASVFNSPVYYLQPNDIIYVEPNKRKFLETNVQLVNYFAQITSTLSILYLFINNFTK
jgi:polysaccharide export outer membrane protein